MMQTPGQINEVHITDESLSDSQSLHHVHYMQQHHDRIVNHENNNGNGGSGMEEEDEDDGAGSEAMEAEVPTDHTGPLADIHGTTMPRNNGGHGNQLTLSFQGEVYVFDSVSPEKVQAVLLLLGGREVPTTVPAIPTAPPHNNRGLNEIPPRLNVPQRIASLIRFREKRKERNFDKKIRYTVRKEVALRMQRHKGQFTSSKNTLDESGSAITTWDSGRWGENGQQEATCRHCGTSGKQTPMMRRGPDGPRTLCNACGLMWANKGTLRDLTKPGTGLPVQNTPPLNSTEENKAAEDLESPEANGSESS